MATLLQAEFSLDFEQPQGCVTLLLGVIFQNHATLSLHHYQAALLTASQGEDGAQLKSLQTHTKTLAHFLSDI